MQPVQILLGDVWLQVMENTNSTVLNSKGTLFSYETESPQVPWPTGGEAIS